MTLKQGKLPHFVAPPEIDTTTNAAMEQFSDGVDGDADETVRCVCMDDQDFLFNSTQHDGNDSVACI